METQELQDNEQIFDNGEYEKVTLFGHLLQANLCVAQLFAYGMSANKNII